MKTLIREEYKQARKKLSKERRYSAGKQALEAVIALAADHSFVMSYASIGDELCTRTINHYLAEEGKLILPRLDQNRLVPCYVRDVSADLCEGTFGILEPKSHCAVASASLILVPGLAFDTENHRVGYGKGCYDRFLALISPEVLTYGIGYREQMSLTPLPIEITDRKLNQILLY